MSWWEKRVTVPQNLSRFGKRYRKTSRTHARELTEDDYANGIPEDGNRRTPHTVHTNEGDANFKPRDFLGEDRLGHYPIRREVIESTKRRVTDPDDRGYADYETTGTVRAKTIFWPFGFRVKRPQGDELHGKFRGKVVVGEQTGDVGVVEIRIFKETYKRTS